jgi:F-type H+-transporting ATPase subunit b
MATEPEHATADAGGAHAAGAGTAHPESGGLPQFEFEYWGGQIVWLLLIFAVLYVLLAKVFVPRLRGVLDLRARTIADAVEQARKVQTEAEEQAKAAQAEIAEARASAQHAVSEAKSALSAEFAKKSAEQETALAARIAKAEAAIAKTREAAMTNVGAVAVDTVQAIVGKLTGETVAKSDASRAVESATTGAA